MSILIKGVEMPKNCAECFAREISGAGAGVSFCRITKGELDFDYDERRMKFCPIVPVPPHGRLGDLDALAQQIEYERFHHTHTDGLAARHHVAEYGHFLKAISDAPTIIPAEEV